MRLFALACALLIALPGCQKSYPAADFVVLSSTDLGPMEQAATIKGRDGGYSGLFRGKSVWLYGDTVLSLAGTDGTSWRNNTASVTADLDASDGITGFTEQLDSKGAPLEFFPQTAAERAFNISHSEVLQGKEKCTKPCGARWALWPGPMVEDRVANRALVVFHKIYGEPGAWSFHSVGMGIATWSGLSRPVVRPEVNSGATHPTLLFGKGEQNFGSAAVVQGNLLYLFGCEGKRKTCKLARVPLQGAHRRSEYRYYAGDGRWTATSADAAGLFEAMDMTTVHYNALLKRWLAVYSPFGKNRLVMRSAPALTGPWSEEVEAAHARAPYTDKEYAYSGMAHPEYSRAGGRDEYLAYYRATKPWHGEIRLVRVRLAPR